MVAFFVFVAGRFGINDNLFGPSGKELAQQRRIGRYLPVPVIALFAAIMLAQSTGLFIPALPLIALIVLLWYGVRYLLLRRLV
jgi:fatty acid desaturase